MNQPPYHSTKHPTGLKHRIAALFMVVALLCPPSPVWARSDEGGNQYERGISLYLEEYYDEAVESFQSHLKKYPTHAPSQDWIQLSQGLKKQDRIHTGKTAEERKTASKPPATPSVSVKKKTAPRKIAAKKPKAKVAQKKQRRELAKAAPSSGDLAKQRRVLSQAQASHQEIQSEIEQLRKRIRNKLRSS